MINALDEDFTGRKKTPALSRIAESLMCTFPLDKNCELAVKEHQRSDTLEEAIHCWLLSTLAKPDEQLGTLLMPMIATRFHDYIESMRNN